MNNQTSAAQGAIQKQGASVTLVQAIGLLREEKHSITQELAAAANQAQEDAPVGFAWSGWACMYPGKLPRLYGALEIASVNLDAANGDQLIHLSTSPGPQAQEDAQDTDRWMGIGKAIERACADLPEETEIIVSLEKDAGTVTLIDQDGNEHENFSTDYGFAGVLNEAIDTAIAARAEQGEQSK